MRGKFALVLTNHRILGWIFNTVIITPSPNREFHSVNDRVSPANLRQYEHTLQPEEIQLVNIIEEYNDNQLLKAFSKKKISTKDFLASLDEIVIEKQVRPYIERRLIRCINVLSGSEIPVYLKKIHNNLYETDRLWLQEDKADVAFSFNRNESGIEYCLTVTYNDEIISLLHKNGFLLSNEPCCFVLENRIFQINDIDGKKLLPFLKKPHIKVRSEIEKKFLETFAKGVIQKYKVHATGITIKDIYSQPIPFLSLETSITGVPALMLKFRYDEKTEYYAGRRSGLKVTLSEKGNNICFTRLNRDEVYENQVISSLLGLGLANVDKSSFAPLQSRHSENILITYDLINWLNFNKKKLEKLGVEISPTNNAERYYLKNIELKLKVQENKNDWFDIQAVVIFDEFEIPFLKFRNYLQEGRREYELPDGRIIVLPEEWFARFSELLSFAGEQNDQLIIEKQHFPLLRESLKGFDNAYSGKLKKWFASEEKEDIELPKELKAVLRKYQLTGYNWLWKLHTNNFGGCLADDMGLGKTLQTLALLQKVINEYKTSHYGPAQSLFDHQLTIFNSSDAAGTKIKPSLIVVPSSLIHNWMNEAKKFVPDLKTGFYGGQNRKDFIHYHDKFDLIITSYGLVRNDVESLKHFEFLYMVLDESQIIKNPHSKTYKAVTSIKTDHKLVLTGTPIENTLTDLWAQMNFLNPGLLGSFEFFRNQFVTPIEKLRDEKQINILQALIKPFVLRRTKKEVARELPSLIQQVIYCDMSESQQAFYETEKSKARNLILDNINNQGIEKSSLIILQSLTRLRQSANHPVLIDNNYLEDSGKHEVILDNIKNLIAEGHKALVFSSFVKHLELFTEFCNREKLKYALLTGELPQHKRESVIREFQQNKDVHLFFISIKAGGFGLNLTAADYVFILDPWWNPAVEEQAMSRAHRIGQDKNVFVYRFISKDTLEEKIHLLQDRKSQLAGDFINNNNPFREGDAEDILKLIE